LERLLASLSFVRVDTGVAVPDAAKLPSMQWKPFASDGRSALMALLEDGATLLVADLDCPLLQLTAAQRTARGIGVPKPAKKDAEDEAWDAPSYRTSGSSYSYGGYSSSAYSSFSSSSSSSYLGLGAKTAGTKAASSWSREGPALKILTKAEREAIKAKDAAAAASAAASASLPAAAASVSVAGASASHAAGSGRAAAGAADDDDEEEDEVVGGGTGGSGGSAASGASAATTTAAVGSGSSSQGLLPGSGLKRPSVISGTNPMMLGGARAGPGLLPPPPPVHPNIMPHSSVAVASEFYRSRAAQTATRSRRAAHAAGADAALDAAALKADAAVDADALAQRRAFLLEAGLDPGEEAEEGLLGATVPPAGGGMSLLDDLGVD